MFFITSIPIGKCDLADDSGLVNVYEYGLTRYIINFLFYNFSAAIRRYNFQLSLRIVTNLSGHFFRQALLVMLLLFKFV